MRQCYSRPLLQTADLQCLSIKMFFSLQLHASVGFYRLGQHGACTYIGFCELVTIETTVVTTDVMCHYKCRHYEIWTWTIWSGLCH